MDAIDLTDGALYPDIAFLVALIDGGVEIDARVMQISAQTWAIHGSVTYGGEIIVAEFDAPEPAHQLLHQLPESHLVHAPPGI